MIRESILRAMSKELSKANKASIVVGVVKKGRREYVGLLENNVTRSDAELGTLYFEIGSTTKTFTSLLLAKLLNEGVIALDEPNSTYKPEYQRALSFKGKQVTFRQLATHTSGLPREAMKSISRLLKEDKERQHNPYKDFTPEHLDTFFRNFTLKKEIGKSWTYSNIGIRLLANTLAEITGKPYEEAIKTEILEPLGMHDTVITVKESEMDRYVKSYNK